MTTDFKDQVVIITGAGQGIGFAIAKALALRGAKVVLNDVDATLAANAAESITKDGGTCMAFAGDASDVNFIKSLVSKAVLEFEKLDIAIANAGITIFGDFFTYHESQLNKVLNLNIKGTFFLAQAASLQMIKQKTGGNIVFTSSVTGHQASKDLEAYGMTKAAIELLAKTLVPSLAPHNISINAIAPGATLTERTMEDPDYEKDWSSITPNKRPAHVEDIANAALFFASRASRHVTGQTLVIDGGWTSVSPAVKGGNP